MGLFLIVLLGGMGLFCVQYLLHAETWVTSPGSPHVYNRGNLGCGMVVDRSGNVLLDMTSGRTFLPMPKRENPPSTGWATAAVPSAPVL